MSQNIALIKINSISGSIYYTYLPYEGKLTRLDALKSINLISNPAIYVTKEYRGGLLETIKDIDKGHCVTFYTGTTESYEILNVMTYEKYLDLSKSSNKKKVGK